MSDNPCMRIAMLTHQWPGARMGGIGSCVRHTALALARAGHEVHVFTPSLPPDVRAQLPGEIMMHEATDLAGRVRSGEAAAESAGAISAAGEGVYRLALGSILCGELLRCHRAAPFDIVEAPEVEALALPLLLSGEFDAPVVTHLHCCTAIAHAANGVEVAEEQRLIQALELASIHLADAVCAATQAVVESTRAFMPIQHPVRIIPHPVIRDPDRPFTSPTVDGPILFVGRIERLKGIEVLTAALTEFLPKHPGVVFRFIGPDTPTAPGAGSMRQWIERQLDPSIRPRVQLVGELSPTELSREWSRARFGVLPSLRENFSMACCEGMAAGRAIIVGAGTGSVELVANAGLVAEQGCARALAECMEQLWTDRDKLARLSASAYQRIRTEFAPGRVAALREAFYRETIERWRVGPTLGERLASLPPACSAAVFPAFARMTSALAGGSGAPHGMTPGNRLLRIMDELQRRHGRPAAVMLYGAGRHTARLFAERFTWESRRHRVIGIIDDHPRFALDPIYLDLPVQSIQAARARVLDGQMVPPVVLSTDTYQDQFWAQSESLRQAGVEVFRLY